MDSRRLPPLIRFNPLHPSKGVETAITHSFGPENICFNPLHPSKGVETTLSALGTFGDTRFQSTPPLKRGGDLLARHQAHGGIGVSIHSTPQKGWRRF